MPKIVTADAAQEPSLTFARDTDGTVYVNAALRGSDKNMYGRNGRLADMPTYIALSAAQKQAFRDALVGIFTDLKTLEFPP